MMFETGNRYTTEALTATCFLPDLPAGHWYAGHDWTFPPPNRLSPPNCADAAATIAAAATAKSLVCVLGSILLFNLLQKGVLARLFGEHKKAVLIKHTENTPPKKTRQQTNKAGFTLKVPEYGPFRPKHSARSAVKSAPQAKFFWGKGP
jgi:hypothetical protein